MGYDSTCFCDPEVKSLEWKSTFITRITNYCGIDKILTHDIMHIIMSLPLIVSHHTSISK